MPAQLDLALLAIERTAAGDAEMAKFGAAVTVSASVAAALRVPDAPVIVMAAVPGSAEALAVRVKVLAPVALLGLNDAVTPLGRPEALSATLLLKPFCGVIVIVSVPLVPWFTVSEPGESPIAKSGFGTLPPTAKIRSS